MRTPPKAANQITVVCDGSACPFAGRERVVSLPPVGHGLFLSSPVRCECGHPADCRTVED